jgi:hypothetical protein
MNEQDNRKPVLAVNKYIRNAPQRFEPESEEAAEAFKVARAKSRGALMLDVRLSDGSIVSFPYQHLSRAKYLPNGAITLRFGRDEVYAEGRNLAPLRDAITEHRARFIQEGTDGEGGLLPEDSPHIERITITEGDEDL